MMASKFFVFLVYLEFVRCAYSSPNHHHLHEEQPSSNNQKTASSNNSHNRSPNIILLFMDDLGYGDLGFTGHPTTHTPHIDKLAFEGKVLTSWYSGCAVCTGSRAALMTGRQFPRTGVSPVFGPTGRAGLPLNETTVAEQLKIAGYTTAIVGKWHLGQRIAYLPGNQGFDYYLGIPYSDDMGDGITSACPVGSNEGDDVSSKEERSAGRTTTTSTTSSTEGISPQTQTDSDSAFRRSIPYDPLSQYRELGLLIHEDDDFDATTHSKNDPAGLYLPLVYQEHNKTRIVEQPLDFTTLARRYNDFAVDFITKSVKKEEPFFLYVPFSHVHVTSPSQPEKQYAGCEWKQTTTRGAFGDALAEADSLIGNIMQTLQSLNVEEDTLVLFASDNGPWLYEGLSGGSVGLLTGRFAGYWSTGKGSTWEGGIRSPSFAYWKGTIAPQSRTSEVVSSLDVLPTLSSIAGVPVPTDRPMDGKDMSDILFHPNGKSKHDFLFMYNRTGITAARHGPYKAHWYTAPGLGGYRNQSVWYPRYPLLFDVEKDPSETTPLCEPGTLPSNPIHRDAMERLIKAYAFEKATFVFGKIIPEPDAPWEGPGEYGLCCDRSKNCNCVNSDNHNTTTNRNSNNNGKPQPQRQQRYSYFDDKLQTTLMQQDWLSSSSIGILDIGTKEHHDRYHSAIGEDEPLPPKTRAQILLRNLGR